MTIGVTIRNGQVFMSAREQSEDSPVFYKFDHPPVGEERSIDDSFRKFLEDAEKVAIGIPASKCFVKKLEIDERLKADDREYLRWMASIQIPAPLDKYEFGFIPLTKSYDGSRTETIFYAAPRSALSGFRISEIREMTVADCMLIPEQVGLAHVLIASISDDDIPQAAIVDIDDDFACAVYIRDGRFCHSRLFELFSDDRDECGLEVSAYLMSRSTPDDPLPLVLSGNTGRLGIDWSPVIPAFIGVKDLDYLISWGLSEFVMAGGQCELLAAS